MIAKGNAVLSAFNNMLLTEWSTNAYPDANGITIYHIDVAKQKTDPYYIHYKGLDFAGQTAWDEFLDAYAK